MSLKKFAFLLLLTSCKTDPFDIKNNEQISVKTTSMGCFQFDVKETKINRQNNLYYVSICTIYPVSESGKNFYGITTDIEIGQRTEIWEKDTYKSFVKKIKDEINENNSSTTSVIHEISLIGTSK
jgi:predicted transcriptional regulator